MKRAFFGENQAISGSEGTTVDIVLRYLKERLLGHCCL